MPIYEYKCQDCGEVTEVFVRSSQEEINLVCSHCKGDNLRKIFSTPSFIRTGNSSSKGSTCCGRTERCEVPPCSNGSVCSRD